MLRAYMFFSLLNIYRVRNECLHIWWQSIDDRTIWEWKFLTLPINAKSKKIIIYARVCVCALGVQHEVFNVIKCWSEHWSNNNCIVKNKWNKNKLVMVSFWQKDSITDSLIWHRSHLFCLFVFRIHDQLLCWLLFFFLTSLTSDAINQSLNGD